MSEEWSQESGAELAEFNRRMAGRRWGRRDGLTGEQRAAMMKRIQAEQVRHQGGRPRTVVHAPGPRGGCRCAECRGRQVLKGSIDEKRCLG